MGVKKIKRGKNYHSPLTKECESVAGQQQEEKQLTAILASAAGLQFKESNTWPAASMPELPLDKFMFSTFLFIFTSQLADFLPNSSADINSTERRKLLRVASPGFFFLSKINTGGVFNHYNLQW